METEFTPEQSFKLINQIIENKRISYEENGNNILMWGIAVMVAGIGQYVLAYTSIGAKSGIIWVFTMIPMFIYTFYSFYKKEKNSRGRINNSYEWNVSGMAWLMAGCMAMLNGFIFQRYYGIGFTTVMFLPFGVAALITALTIKKNSFIYLTLLAISVAFYAMFIPFKYHSLVTALIAFLMFFLPGLLLNREFKKRNNV
ncbi:MAG: hypothetical protein V3V00_13980 [Saprospiraceae bacterium]